ncbi:MAG: sugar ABC transporter permease [Clostridiales bacterium]|nr:sugar ABC transporter permease [Clostridiales bacterium]
MAIKNEHSLGRRIRKSAVSYAMMAPFMLFFFVFIVLPVLSAIVLSFTDFNMLQSPHVVWFANYQRLFTADSVFLTALKNTLILAIICGPAGYLFAFLMAWLINEMPRKLRVLLTVIFYAPSVSGNVYFIWTYLFSGDSYGIVNGWLMELGLIQSPILWMTNPQYNLTIIIVIQLWLSLGVSFLSFIAGLQGIDKSQYEAGAIDGVKNRFQELWYITVPNMKSMLLFGAVMQIAGVFGIGDITTALGGGFNSVNYSTLTILNHIQDYGSVRYEMGYACCIAVILFIMIVLTKKLIFRLLKW